MNEPIYRALCIDVEARSVTERRLCFQDAKAFVGEWLLALSFNLDAEPGWHVLLVQADGHATSRCTFGFGPYTRAGNGLIMGHDGASFRDCALSLEYVSGLVSFVNA